MANHLNVWLLEHLVGQLQQVDGRLRFAYLDAWLDSPIARPLSIQLPLQPGLFSEAVSRAFFAGLLPEGANRQLIARRLQVSRQNDFALLNSIGGECAGAVSLLPPGEQPEPSRTSAAVQWLDEQALADVLHSLPQRPMLAGEDGLRLSLAGAQDKLPVFCAQGRIGLPLHNTASTHILKPAIASAEGSVSNEAFCLALAAKLGLPAAHASIQYAKGQEFLLVERYDRQQEAAQVERLHQEDFCQALGIVPEHKYQNEGGPSLPQCFALLRQATRPSAPHVLRLLDAVIFNALIGNHDAHGKNFSLLYRAQTPVLAPLYDLLCTVVYPQFTQKMAMKIGSRYKFTELQARHWQALAQECQLAPAQVRQRVLALARLLPESANELKTAFAADGHKHPVLQSICEHIEQRCALAQKRLSPSLPSATASSF
ncbi:MAG: type II toxin-antitoxin system HipA family toxin [Comamonas sp.]|nr:type II toxin-antitoxin system HipA family toxin [Comamonas sp.]